MENYQFWTLVGMLGAGFGWMISRLSSIDLRLNKLETRVTIIETILSMMASPLKLKQKNDL